MNIARTNYLEKLRFAANQNKRLGDYWLNRLGGEWTKSTFPYNYANRTAVSSESRVEKMEFRLGGEQFSKLLQFSNNSDLRLHMILVAGVAALLYKYTGSDDIIVGTPIYKQKVEGEFINTLLPLRHSLTPDMTFKELLLQVRRIIREAVDNQGYPMEILIEQLNMSSSENDFPLFDVAVLLENIHDKAYLSNIRFPILFSFLRTQQYIKGVVEYDSFLYENSMIKQIIDHFCILLQVVLANVQLEVSRIEMLSEEEKKLLLVDFNNIGTGYPQTATIHSLFEAQVERTSDSAAVIAPVKEAGSYRTYRELNRQSNRLAHMLRKKGIGPNRIVGMMMEPSLEMIVGILGVLKAGGAYLPINPDYPLNRIVSILEDSGASILLTQSAFIENGAKLPDESILKEINGIAFAPGGKNRDNFAREIMIWDEPGERKGLPGESDENLQHINQPTDLAYIIYTSGTTGKPKGALIEHKNVVRLMVNDDNLFDFNSCDVWTLFHSYAFDFSVWEMYGALLFGGTLVLIPKMISRDPKRFLEVLKQHHVTILNQTPSAFYSLIDEELGHWDATKQLHLRYVIFGGEALWPGKLKNWREKYPGTKLVNMFGITETTVHVTYKEVGQHEIDLNLSNIGRPIPTLSVYVMDDHLRILPIGVPGELCVGGKGVGRGYLNRPELTDVKFVQTPYKLAERLYRSGDLGKWLSTGELMYLGRKDRQVKIRGFRIEMGEIENQLLKHDEIKEAVAARREDKETAYLCGYIVADRKFSPSELRDYLSAALPDYMIPGYFVQLDRIPLTSNGKVDRKALPQVEIVGDEYTAPRDPLEEKLAQIWQQVLDLEKVGIKDNFFNIGGDSIKIIKLVSAINTQLSANFKIVDVYTNETIEKLALQFKQDKPSERDEELEVLKELEQLKNRVLAQDILPNAEDIEDVYPMSDIESGMLFYSLSDRELTLYHDQMVYQVKYRNFDPKIYKRAVVLMAEKHSILRTCFNIEDFGQSLQVVYKNVELNNIEHRNISNMNIPGQETYLNQFLEEDRRNPFKLTEPLWRMRTFDCGSGNIVVMFTAHHAIIDGWSNAAFLTELNNTYIMLKSEPGFVPQKLKNTYKAFIIEQIIEKRNRVIYDYWRNELQGYKRLELPGRGTGRYDDVDEQKRYMHELGPELAERLKNSAKKYNSSLDHLCFGAYVYMLGMLSYDNDIVTGLVVNNRPQCEDGDKIVGCFLNTVPVRIRIPVNIIWLDYIGFIDGKLLELKKYERLSLFEIVRILGEKPEDRNPLFDMLFNFIDFHILQQLDADNDHHVANANDGVLSVPGYVNTNTLIDFNVDNTFGRFMLGISYSQRLVGDRVIRQLCSYFERVLDKFVDETDGFVNRSEIVSKEEKEMILVNFNDTKTGYPREKTITDLFEEQVKKTPDAKAAVYEDEALTYKELDKRAHCLARLIRKKGLKPDTAVGIMSGPSLEIIVGILGILKGGGAYLSIDPGCPDERKRYMLEDSQVRLVLSRGLFTGTIKNIGNKYEVINLQSEHLYRGSIEKSETITGSDNLAYVIYTSGSTGSPKAVMVEHRSVVRLVKNANYIEFNAGEHLLQTGALEFDASTFEIWGVLLNGMTLYETEKEIIVSADTLKSTIQKYQITTIWLTSPLFNRICQVDMEVFATLKYLLVGGDVLSPPHINRVRKKYPGLIILNGYGPTENTTFSATFRIERLYDGEGETIPIGCPIANSTTYIVDRNHHLQPMGAVGELWVGGDGVARGYLNNPELTAERFIDKHSVDNRCPIPNERIYRTGDLCRWLPDGNIQFFGRIDRQVKIRGFRIELGEIENHLLHHESIEETVVIDRKTERGEKCLCAYLVPKSGMETLNTEPPQFREYLLRFLPEYMIPSYFVTLERIPLTPNGKVDRKALPEPKFTAGEGYIGPRDEIEKALVRIWSEVLAKDTLHASQLEASIGIDADFFDLGGHSLKVTSLVSRVHKALNVKLTLVDIFSEPTIRAIGEIIRKAVKRDFIPIEPAPNKAYYAQSYAQKRLFILQQMDVDSKVYNLPQIYPLDQAMDLEELEGIFRKLIQRHESLRTSFEFIDGKAVQKVHEEVELVIQYIDFADESAMANFIHPFDLSQAPLLRVRVIEKDSRPYLLMVDMHHIISDGVSHNILIQDFHSLSKGELLPKLGLQYKDYAEWQQKENQQKEFMRQKAYWLSVFDNVGEIPVLDLPYDYPRPKARSFEGNYLISAVGIEATAALKDTALKVECTMFMTLLAVFNVLLTKLSGQEEIIVGNMTAGRRHADLEKIIGMFVNTLPLWNSLAPGKPFNQFLRDVKERTLSAFENQEYPFEDLVEQLSEKLTRDISRNPLFDVAFVLQNQNDKDIFPVLDESLVEGTAENELLDYRVAKFDLAFTAGELADSLLLRMEYCTKLFKKETVERFIRYFKNIISIVAANPAVEIADIEIITEKEKGHILKEFNRTSAEYPADKTLQRLFADQVEKTPDKVAIVGSGQWAVGKEEIVVESAQLTYRELNRQANRLARYLRSKYDIKPETIIAIMMEPCLEMMVGILGILKAGAAYLPIDPDYPEHRILSMLEDSQTLLILTTDRSLTIKKKSFLILKGVGLVKAQPYSTIGRPQVSDPDQLPIPDRSLVNYEEYNRYIGQAMVKNSISLQATRGCPYQCEYCHKIWPHKHVVRSAANIFAEVQLYYNMGVRRFAFIDDIFNLDIQNSIEFFKQVIRHNYDLQLFFPNGMRGDILTEEYIDLMVQAGTVGLALALETASPRLQKLIKKNLNLEKLRENIEYFTKKYPHVILELFTMHGFPSETEEEARMTLDFIKSVKWLHFPYFHVLKIYPNTGMARLALQQGISPAAIDNSADLAYHELPDTLPFDKHFTLKCQAEFLDEYFLAKERLLHVLPYQMKALSEEELVQKYNSYLPVEIESLDDLLKLTGLERDELGTGLNTTCVDKAAVSIPGLNEKMQRCFPVKIPAVDGLKVLLLDLSQYFSHHENMLYDVVEPPLGLMYLMSYLHRELGDKVNGKIAKSRIDFDNYRQLKALLEAFEPDVIGIRTLTFYRDFFHKTAALIRQWGITAPIIAGGPYATSDYDNILQDRNVDVVVLGEGELTFNELIGKILENGKKLPGEEVLREIKGITFVPDRERARSRFPREILFLDELTGQLSGESNDDIDMEHINQPEDLAYIIFTSGSTGKPKGCMVSHKNVVRLLKNDKFLFDFSARDTWIMAHSFCFDFSVWEMYGALLYGGKLIVIPRMAPRDPAVFLEVLKDNDVTVLNQTPSAFYNLINEAMKRPGIRLNLRYVIFGGEALKPGKLRAWKTTYPGTRLINMFGITETTVHVTFKEIGDHEVEYNISNIGGPIPTLTTYIMDNRQRLLPLGVSGELCVGGDGVGRGYLNRPELTAVKFVPDPRKPTERLYRSGDLAKWRDNGDMVYMGRGDHQVKIRGYRIELGEIENRLLKHDGINEAVVMTRKGKEEQPYLCAYFVPGSDGDGPENRLTVKELREYLLKELPEYMVPSYFVPLGALPLTSSSKVDQKALPDPAEIELDSGVEFVASRNDIEVNMTEVWKHVLGRGQQKVGIHDNFFMLGGDSIKSIQIASQMKRLGYEVSIKDLFLHPTIAELAPLVKKVEKIADQSVISGQVHLTPIQKAFFMNKKQVPNHYNQAVLLYSRRHLEDETVRRVFTRIQAHHDALRMTFAADENGEVRQINHGLDYPFDFQVFDLRRRDNAVELLENKANDIQAGIDLESGPLMKTALFHLDDGDRLLVAIHHLVIDGISWRILFEDIESLYTQYTNKEELELPLKTDSFKVWAEQLSQYANSGGFLKEKTYWAELEARAAATAPIPKDFAETDNIIKETAALSFSLSREETGLLLSKVNEAFGTVINDILLTALGRGLKENFDNDQVVIALEGHGREEILPPTASTDITRTVGWFTSVYPVVLDVSYENDADRQIKEVKETLRRVPNKGIGYGILKYLTAKEHKRDIEFKSHPQVSFNYLGQFDADTEQMASFQMARESGGRTMSLEEVGEYELDVTGILANHCLNMSVVFNPKQYRPETIDRLINHFESQLKTIISYCSRVERRQLTPGDFTYKGLAIDTVDALTSQIDGEIEDIYTLSPMQEGMLFHALYDADSSAYFEQPAFRLQGELDPGVVQESLNELAKRYDVLRTAIYHEGLDRPIQVVLKDRPLDFYYEDICRAFETAEAKEKYIREFKEKDIKRAFNLSRDPLMRVAILKLDQSEYEFIWSHHHLLMDGWCLGILIREFLDIYRCFRENKPSHLPPAAKYKTYIQWLEKQDKEELRMYWSGYLQGYEETAGVPRMKGYPVEQRESYKNENADFALGVEKTRALNRWASRNQVTLNTVIQAVWGIILGKYTGKQDVVFGAVVSGRPPEVEGVETMVGLFINTIPVRIRCEAETSFSHLLQSTQRAAIESEPHHYYPLAEIQAETPLKNNLLDHIIAFENYPIAQQVEGADNDKDSENKVHKKYYFRLSRFDAFEHTNYNFNIVVSPGNSLAVKFIYNGNLYKEDFVRKVAAHITHVLDQVLVNDQLAIRAFTLLSGEEKQQVLVAFNDTRSDYPAGMTIHRLFEQQAEKTPDRVALRGPSLQEGDSISMTYEHLNRTSQRLARMLRCRGVTVERIVGIQVEHSVEMLVGILGILKAGGAYVPIDPGYPQDRIDYMLTDSGAKILLRELSELSGLSKDPTHLTHLIHPTHPTHLCYLIYTSGTTGRPKGSLVEHRSLVNLCYWHNDYFRVTEKDRATKYANIGFDASVWEIFPYLIKGASLHIIDDDIKLDIQQLADYYEKQQITISFLPTQFCQQFMEQLAAPGSLRVLLTGGDKLNRFVETGYRLYNNYGPTENTVVATSCPVEVYSDNIPIGKPIANSTAYILDRYFHLLPVGIPGQLCVGGKGLSRGYLNDPELTHEKFIVNPFLKEERLYQTGDQARWLWNGEIEFLGRSDRQIKIRGFRIEPGEIETQLLKAEYIKEAIVTGSKSAEKVSDDTDYDGDKFICAYIVSEQEADYRELRNKLSENLPDYMLPTYFISLERIPLTPSGKVDWKSLPDPEAGIFGEKYVAPRDEMEKQLAHIWSEVLGIKEENIGIDTSFFDLGGHSLKVTVLAAKIHKVFDIKVPIAEIFVNSTIAELSQYIRGAKEEKYAPIGSVEKKEYYCLSSAQKRMYYLQQMDPANTYYNTPRMVSWNRHLNKEKLEKTFKGLFARHENFRTSMEMIDNEPVQRVHEDVDFEIEYYSTDMVDTDTVVKKFIRPFALNKAPLIRVGLIREAVEKYILLVDMHHIITDGVSMDIIIREFMALNDGKELPPLRLQCKDYAEWLNSDEQKNAVKKQEEYWVKEFQGEIPVLNFPTDYPKPPVRSFEGDRVTFEVDSELTGKIKEIVIKLELTPYTFFLAAYYILLSKYSKQEDIIIGTGVTGRTHADLQDIVGMFVNMLPMKNRPQGNKTFREFLLEVKINALNAFENQDYQFEEFVNRLGIKVDLKRNPLFETVFQFQDTNAKRTEDVHVDAEEGDQAKAFQDRYEYNAARYELMIEAFEFEGSIRMMLTYSTALFKRATMEKFAGRYLEILKQVTEDDAVKLKDIALSHDLLTAAKDTAGFDFVFESFAVSEAGSLKEGEENDGLK